MTQEQTRREILDLLARGKISLDEAVVLLEDVTTSAAKGGAGESVPAEEVVFKVDMDEDDTASLKEELSIEEIPVTASGSNGDKPRWLRIRVQELDSGKSKVTVNIPFGMVKFGMSMAQLFAPEKFGPDLEQIGAMISRPDDGLLVDVRDDESNEHVQIYIE